MEINDNILNGLNELRLYGMAGSWEAIVANMRRQDVSLSQGLEIMIQAEKDHRSARKTANLLKRAKFRYDASIGEIFFDSGKGKDRDRIMQLASCEYVRNGLSVLISGPSGVGKSFMASALGQQACLTGFKVRYYTMSKLLEDIKLARVESKIVRFYEQVSDFDLLVIEDFGLFVLDKQQLLDFMDIVEDRHARRSMIITSQLPLDKWYEILSANKTVADAIIDRILNSSYTFNLKGSSLRGIKKNN